MERWDTSSGRSILQPIDRIATGQKQMVSMLTIRPAFDTVSVRGIGKRSVDDLCQREDQCS